MAPSTQRSTAPNQVRIIGGRWRRRLIHFPQSASLRPTPDRVRETLFNWLGQDLSELAVLDLFAGSGALSLESLSRGARLAVAVDATREAVVALRENAAILGAEGLEIHRADALAYLGREQRRFDIVFIDPPFSDEWLDRLWPLLPQCLNRGGWLYVEQPREIVAPSGWTIFRHQSAGRVHYHLLRRESDSEVPEEIQ
ncbi:MAG: 16S rRNA (guanine(966)-N(2))-methyltransferase RsmD [Casimicrobiaceae bacterium]